MKKMFTKISYCLTVALGISMISSAAIAKTELTMYYPIAVGGKLTQAVDSIVADFMAENPDIQVNAIYSGNYDDTRIKALAALESGKPAQLSVMFSIDVHELRELDAIVPFDDVVSVDILYREAGSPVIYIVDTISKNDPFIPGQAYNYWNSRYVYNTFTTTAQTRDDLGFKGTYKITSDTISKSIPSRARTSSPPTLYILYILLREIKVMFK